MMHYKCNYLYENVSWYLHAKAGQNTSQLSWSPLQIFQLMVEEPGEERESISIEEIEENTYLPERVIHALWSWD